MCKGNCKCKCKINHDDSIDESDCICIKESSYLFAKEMHQHYKELFETALSQLKFKSLNVEHLLCLLEEVVVLLWNGRPAMMIAKVIDNWIERYNIDLNINNSMIGEWQPNFSDIVGNDDLDDEEVFYEEEQDDAYLKLLDTVKGLVNYYIDQKNAKN